jgi:hypothetical protein
MLTLEDCPMAADVIACPHCGGRIQVSKLLTQQIRTELEEELAGRIRAEESRLKEQSERQLRADRQRLEVDARKKAEAAAREELDRAERESKRQSAEIRKLSELLERNERGRESEIRKQVQLAKKKLETEIGERLDNEYRGRDLEAQRKLSDARNQIGDLKRRLDDSTRQLQGDIVEGRLADILALAFGADDVQAIGKRGGADVVQCVRAQNGETCGTIVWESKNTAAWSNAWLTKLRQDQRRVKADVAVLVSSARPKNGGRLEFIDGVWVTDLTLAVGLATVLRSHLIQLQQHKVVSPAGDNKFAAIQRYLSSTEFRQRIEAMVEAFQTMQTNLEAERRAMERHWAEREKNLRMVIDNVSGMYGELHAVVGPTLARVRRLELPEAS